MKAAVPRLAVHDAQGRRVVPVDNAPFTIGRRTGHHLQLAGAGVSRDHAEIAARPEGYVLRDTGSQYGTFVNGVRVTEQVLAYGDRIECGRDGAALIFLAPDADAGGRPSAASVRELRQVASLLDALRQMGSHRVVDEVLAVVLDAAIEATGAERGLIMLASDAGALEPKLARGAGGVPLPLGSFATSRKIPEQVFATGQITVVADLLEGDAAAVHTGTVALGIRHVLCAPLRLVRYVEQTPATNERGQLGVLYLDSRTRGRLLSPATHAALETLAAEAALAIESARLYQRALEKARLDEELRIASHIQQALLPEAARSGAFFEAVGASVPSRGIGGDFFAYEDLPEQRFGFGIGDITGKGPPAALITALVQGVLAVKAPTGATPDEAIKAINDILLARRVDSRYLTLFLGALAADGALTYCNAGHNPPLLFGAAGLERLEAGGTIVGAFSDAAYERGHTRMAPGDTVVLFSDGITEALSVEGEEFGEDRVRDTVEAVRGQAPDAILRTLLDTVRTFAAGAPQHDDLTAVVLRYTGRP